MTFNNRGFEEGSVGPRGYATSWTVDTQSSVHTPATYGGDGGNLLQRGYDLSIGVAWTPTNATLVGSAVAGPAGLDALATTLTDDAVNGAHSVTQTIPLVASLPDTNTSTVSVWARAPGPVDFLSIATPSGAAWFNLDTGTVAGAIAIELEDCAIEDFGGGWYRCSVRRTLRDGVWPVIFGAADTALGLTYAGTSVVVLELWGATWNVGPDLTSFMPGTAVVLPSAGEYAYEAFGSLWQQNELYYLTLTEAGETVAEYDSVPVTPKYHESFEELWDSNEDYLYALGPAIRADYAQDSNPYHLTFDGSDDVVVAPTNAAWQFTNNDGVKWSLSVWLRVAPGVADGFYMGVSFDGQGWGAYLDAGQPTFYLTPNILSVTKRIQRMDTTVDDGTWHHLVVTHHRIGSNNHAIAWYLDGAVVASTATHNTLGNSAINYFYDFSLGDQSGGTTAPQAIAADLANASLFGDELNSAEVASLYALGIDANVTVSDPSGGDLSAYWPMNQAAPVAYPTVPETELGGTADGVMTNMDPGDVVAPTLGPDESFEGGWLNDNFLATWVAVLAGPGATTAIYDGAVNEPYEDFNEEWASNELYIYAFTPADITAGGFYVQDAGGNLDHEPFNANDWPNYPMVTV